MLLEDLNDCFGAKEFYFKAYEMYNKLSYNKLKTYEIDYAILCMKMGLFMYEKDASLLAVKKILNDAQRIFINYSDYEEYSVFIKTILKYID